MNDALKALTRMQEEATGDKVPVPAHVLELAGSHSQIPANLRSTRSGRYGEYTPHSPAGQLCQRERQLPHLLRGSSQVSWLGGA